MYWHPGLRWHIDRIYVLHPIRFAGIRRNEVKSVVSASNVRTVMSGGQKPLYIDRSADIQQRAAMVLKDVRYVIEAHFTLTDRASDADSPGKFQDIVKRRLESGKCYHTPYFGCREFPANFRRFAGKEPRTAYPGETMDLGYMPVSYTHLAVFRRYAVTGNRSGDRAQPEHGENQALPRIEGTQKGHWAVTPGKERTHGRKTQTGKGTLRRH